ncbi:MAG: IS110 family transposase [Verrucomicrobiota bacterium]
MKSSSCGLTIGLDLGDKKHSCCVLDAQGKVLKKETIANERPALKKLAADWPEALIVMEAGTHSPWISRFFKDPGHRVLVANPRRVRAIYKAERKSDDRDAELPARIARVDEALLHPVEHGDEKQQRDMLAIKLRDAPVRSRVGIINAVRFTLKSLGHPVSNPASERFHKSVMEEVPENCQEVIRPMVEVLEKMTAQIREMEREILRLGKENYPQAEKLRQITGVGPITSLYFVLKVGNADRFGNIRDIGACLGLTPRRDQSGGTDKQLGITKCGDTYLRCLLVNAAQYIMGSFGPPGALREYGEKLRGTTGREKKRAVIAVARKLAVLMLSLWKSGNPYEARATPIAA